LSPVHSLRIALRDAFLVTAACGVVGVVCNLLRSDGIPFIQRTEYQLLVPCPETTGKADPVRPEDPALAEKGTLLIDARPRTEFERWHPLGALHIPYDYLEPTDPAAVQRVLSSGAQRVIVFGDGSDPDSGEHLAKELSGKGIRNIGFVAGGAPALQKVRAGGAP
jgi:hypothetical protein